ncbi:hypothetical protein Ae201684P_009817 [Aphanomyces euteiches]|nr:hypothetical protein Ae201684P_009817 [Aphanomyces euteiches]
MAASMSFPKHVARGSLEQPTEERLEASRRALCPLWHGRFAGVGCLFSGLKRFHYRLHSPMQGDGFQVRRHHVLALALACMVSGQFFTHWKIVPSTITSNIIVLASVATGYACYTVVSNAIFQIIQFSGGTFGLARISLGFHMGFLVAWAECLEYTLSATSAAVSFGHLFIFLAPTTSTLQPILYVLVHAAALAVGFAKASAWWQTTFLFGCTVIVALASVVALSSSSILSFHAFEAPTAVDVMHLLPWFASAFLGTDCLHLWTDRIASPDALIPHVKLRCLSIAILSAVVLTVSLANAPSRALQHIVAAISLLPALVLVVCWLQCAAHVLRAMAASRLVAKQVCRQGHYPIAAVAALSFTLCLLHYACPDMFDPMGLCLAFAFVRQFAQCCGFLYLRRLFRYLGESLSSRRITACAYGSLALWMLSFVSLVAQDAATAGIVGGLFLVGSIFYFSRVRSAQKFSDAERKSLMFAHVIVQQEQDQDEEAAESPHGAGQRAPQVHRLVRASRQCVPTNALQRQRSMPASSFIVRQGKIISLDPHPASMRRKSSSKSIELATLE